MYVYFDIYGEPARGIDPTTNREEAISNGKRFGLEVFDAWEEITIFDPRDTLAS